MTMRSYAVYDRETGEVVQLHVEPAELDSAPEEILRMAGPREARRFGVVEVPPGGAPVESLRVVEGRLVAAGKEADGPATGGAGLTGPAPQRRYERG